MSFIDRAVLSFSPEAGLRRIKARAAANTIMNYDAASKGRRTYGWKAPSSAADAAANTSRNRLRYLSRDMIRNRPYAARGQAVITGNVVGTGITPSVTMPDQPGILDKDEKARVKAALDLVKAHMMSPAIDVYGVHGMAGLQAQVMDTVFSDGEVLVRRRLRDRRYNPTLPVLLQIQLMEADHLDETITSYGQNEVVEGVEYGPTGTIVAYHLFTRHPGDIRWWSKGALVSERVPAGEILHVRRVSRPGQLRGVPWLAPVMMTLGELSDYQEAQILKQRIASLLAFFVKSGPDAKPYDGKAISEISPGAVVGLEEGQDVVAATPPTVDGYAEFMRQGLSTIAMGLGITYESFAGDLRGVNFSSGRMGRMEMDRFVQVWQQQLIINQFCTGVARWFLDAWRLQAADGTMPQAPAAIEWTAPRRPMIDPSKEIKAAIDEIAAGLTSTQRKQREMGHDPDTIAAERAEDAARTVAPVQPQPKETAV
jgi:lambda family phage portal protein